MCAGSTAATGCGPADQGNLYRSRRDGKEAENPWRSKDARRFQCLYCRTGLAFCLYPCVRAGANGDIAQPAHCSSPPPRPKGSVIGKWWRVESLVSLLPHHCWIGKECRTCFRALNLFCITALDKTVEFGASDKDVGSTMYG